MRIIAGEWRGRRLAEPKGRETTRPTTDRVREACASMVDSALDGGIEGSVVLDAFAGSGALGIEMLSRGAASAVFFDVDRGAAALARKNLEGVGCDRARYRVTCGDVIASAGRGRVPGGPFGLVLLDPPYALDADAVASFLEALADSGSLVPGAVALYEHAAGTPSAAPRGFESLRQKRYGGTAVDILRLIA